MRYLGIIGIGTCILGLTLLTIALVEFYSVSAGSSPIAKNAILFSVLFFPGVVLALLGLGILIYLLVYRRERGKA